MPRDHPTFWNAFAADINSTLVVSGQSVSVNDCRHGLQDVFSLVGNAPLIRPGVTVTDVAVHGDTATASQAANGSHRGPMKFVFAGGRWQIGCCIGRQLEQQPRVPYRVPSTSMMPTLRIGEIIVADDTALQSRPRSLGAIVVFHPPAGADMPQGSETAAPNLRRTRSSHAVMLQSAISRSRS